MLALTMSFDVARLANELMICKWQVGLMLLYLDWLKMLGMLAGACRLYVMIDGVCWISYD